MKTNDALDVITKSGYLLVVETLAIISKAKLAIPGLKRPQRGYEVGALCR